MPDRSGPTALQRALKRSLDILGALGALVVLAPVLAGVALVVRTTSAGPVFFRQDRAGLDGRTFRIWKFRSMTHGADRHLDAAGRPAEPRLTPPGPFLRRWGLDELPQLLNVLRGDMSLIGPRPFLPDRVGQLDEGERTRFRMRPGITGLAQVSGRNSLPWSRRLALDREYVDRYSLWLDLIIVARTVRVLVLREGFKADRNPDEVDDLTDRRRPGEDG